jgi:hypothetical protein
MLLWGGVFEEGGTSSADLDRWSLRHLEAGQVEILNGSSQEEPGVRERKMEQKTALCHQAPVGGQSLAKAVRGRAHCSVSQTLLDQREMMDTYKWG